MGYRYDIYVGSDNGSRKISNGYLSKVIEWANEAFPEGYTLLSGKGCWKGKSEDCLMLNVLTDDDSIVLERLRRLKKNLGQESILLSKYRVDLETV
jgi:hypothetical protein